MGLFRPYERSAKTNKGDEAESASKRLASLTPSTKSEQAPTDDAGTVEAAKPIEVTRGPRVKDAPTPTRKQAEAERMERLHPTRTPKEQRKADRQARTASRIEAMDRAEQSPERQLLRDYVDSRWTINEFVLPGMILIMAATMITINNVELSSFIALGLWLLMTMAIINSVVMWRSFKKILAERHPGTNTRGLGMYMFNRALMIRRFRRPAPRVARGEFR